MLPNSSTDRCRGFSFIEVLTATSLLAIVTVGVLLMTTANINSNSFTQHHTKAVQLAEDGLEMLRRVDYNAELEALDGTVMAYGSNPQYMEYRRTLNVVWAADISTLRATVTWRLMGNDSRPIVLSTQRVAP